MNNSLIENGCDTSADNNNNDGADVDYCTRKFNDLQVWQAKGIKSWHSPLLNAKLITFGPL